MWEPVLAGIGSMDSLGAIWMILVAPQNEMYLFYKHRPKCPVYELNVTRKSRTKSNVLTLTTFMLSCHNNEQSAKIYTEPFLNSSFCECSKSFLTGKSNDTF